GLAAEALAAMARRGLCRDEVAEFFASWAPPAGGQMLVIGCAGGESMTNNPTQALIDAGLGGLFIDARKRHIARARRKFGGPHRMIINATVTPSVLPGMLQQHSRFVQQTEVVQVDVDSFDGPLLMQLLEVVSPSVIVVEVRHVLPFPFRYACVECKFDEVVAHRNLWGATLGYWVHELERRGYEVGAMDQLDALFVRRGSTRPHQDRRELFLATMACYLRNRLIVRRPRDLFVPGGKPVEPTRANLEAIRANLTRIHSGFRFALSL
ncbi:unnamed protein product, partial [Prorocentrum cordatum]